MRVENAAKPWFWRLGGKTIYFTMVWRLRNRFFLGLEAVKPVFYVGFVAFWDRKSLSGGLREASGGALEAPEAARRLPIGTKADF